MTQFPEVTPKYSSHWVNTLQNRNYEEAAAKFAIHFQLVRVLFIAGLILVSRGFSDFHNLFMFIQNIQFTSLYYRTSGVSVLYSFPLIKEPSMAVTSM